MVADELVALGAVPSGGPGALVGPGPLRAGPFGQGADGLGVLLVALAGLRAGTLAFAEVGVVAAAVEVPAVLVAVELEDLGGGAGQELAVVADHDDAGGGVGDEPLQAVQAGQVQVVGRLVEQEDVEPAQQERGQTGAGGLAARQRGHRLVEGDVQTHVRGHRADA